jgi:hypothetical protein
MTDSLHGQSDSHPLTIVHVLWAASEQYPRPQFVTAFNDGIVEAWTEIYLDMREKACAEWEDFGDYPGPWTFWVTVEKVPTPSGVPADVL